MSYFVSTGKEQLTLLSNQLFRNTKEIHLTMVYEYEMPVQGKSFDDLLRFTFLPSICPATWTVPFIYRCVKPLFEFLSSSLWGGNYFINICLSLGTSRVEILFRAYRPNSLETLCNFQKL
jgi:hypothetical protein